MRKLLLTNTPDNRTFTLSITDDGRFVAEVKYGPGIANTERITFELDTNTLNEVNRVMGLKRKGKGQ